MRTLLAQQENFWSSDSFEIVLFAVGIAFTFTLFGIFIYVLTRKDEADDDSNPSSRT